MTCAHIKLDARQHQTIPRAGTHITVEQDDAVAFFGEGGGCEREKREPKVAGCRATTTTTMAHTTASTKIILHENNGCSRY